MIGARATLTFPSSDRRETREKLHPRVSKFSTLRNGRLTKS